MSERPITCWGLSDMCRELHARCKAAGECVLCPAHGKEPPCSTHPDAPHGFNRNGSHNAGRYVCDCEGWSPA